MTSRVLFHIKPNGYGSSDFYAYRGDVRSIERISTAVVSASGWLAEFRSLCPRYAARLAVYRSEGDIYIDYGRGPLNLSKGEVEIEWKRISCVLFGHFKSKGSGDVMKFVVITPWIRYLSNDGSFPDDVEPLYVLLKRIKEDPETIGSAADSGK